MSTRISAHTIKTLQPNEVFVFGSNEAGKHYGGAANTALTHFGAILGQGVGLQGQSYAIPSLDGNFARLPLENIGRYVEEFIAFAISRPELQFHVTLIGCGIAGFKVEEIAPLFRAAIPVENIWLPKRFVEVLQ